MSCVFKFHVFNRPAVLDDGASAIAPDGMRGGLNGEGWGLGILRRCC